MSGDCCGITADARLSAEDMLARKYRRPLNVRLLPPISFLGEKMG